MSLGINHDRKKPCTSVTQYFVIVVMCESMVAVIHVLLGKNAWFLFTRMSPLRKIRNMPNKQSGSKISQLKSITIVSF